MSVFDKAALTYDADFTFTETGKLQRAKVRKALSRLFNSRKLILELNCGTGEDARWMAKLGHDVTATDISEEMIRQAKEKTADGNPSFQRIGFSGIDSLEQKFDLVFSNFGGLNCASPEELKTLDLKLCSVSGRETILAFVIMGRRCIWERFYFFLKRDSRKHRRSSGKPVMTDLGSGSFPVYYYSPAEFADFFPSFVPLTVKPVGLFVPPSYLDRSFRNLNFLLKGFSFFDMLFDSSFFADYADHYLIVMKKMKTSE